MILLLALVNSAFAITCPAPLVPVDACIAPQVVMTPTVTPLPTPTSLKYPVRKTSSGSDQSIATLGSGSTDVVIFPYTGAMRQNDLTKLFYSWGGIPVVSTSPTGLSGSFNPTNRTPGSIPYGTILFARGSYFAMDNIWVSGNSNARFWTSPDGLNWTKKPYTVATGEDTALMYNDATNEFYAYVRTIGGGRGPRTISFMKSSDFNTWTPKSLILEMDAQDLSQNKEFYSMPVEKINGTYYGFLNVLRKGNGGQDTEQLPPYSGDEQTIDVQLVYSSNGTSFTRAKNKSVFIPRTNGIMQLFAMKPILENGKVVFYTLETKRRHTLYENQNKAGRYFNIGRYEMSVSDLESWKN